MFSRHDELAGGRLVSHAVQHLDHLAIHEAAEARARTRARRSASSARTSSTTPRCELLRPRGGHARAQHRRAAGRRPIVSTRNRRSASVVASKCAVSGRPVSRYTSSARTRRFRSRGWMRSADAGSTRPSQRCSARHAAPRGHAIEPRAQLRRRAPARETGRARARDSRSPCRRPASAAGRAR